MLLEARNITKKFPGVVALRDVTFGLIAGEIHALCGENGAGKSTLIKLLSGIYPEGSYEGELRLEGVPARFKNIRDAETAGIAVITQEFALIDEMTVAENIFLGRAPRRGLRVDWLEMNRRAAALLADFGLPISPEAHVRTLGIGQKQLLEIVRAMDKKSRILVLDEPTAALTEQEVHVLLNHLRRLRAQGTACIYISHKLTEVFAVADRVTILRDGATVRTLPISEASIPLVIQHMVGREIADLFPRRAPAATDSSKGTSAKKMFAVRGLTVAPAKNEAPFLHDINFDLHAGEVLGIGGLMGAGRTELLMHLFGAWGHRIAGDVTLRERVYANPSPRASLDRGLVLVTEDRRRYGLVLEKEISFNLSLSSLRQFTNRSRRINLPAEHHRNQQLFDALRIKAPHQQARVGGLSGGNQQKVVLGKTLMTEPHVVMLDEPTRGIDVGAKLEIYELVNQLTSSGKAVLLVSSELPELMGLSDRIIMLHEGKIGGEFSRAEFTQERLLAAAMGRAG